jgi:hypothetical protein
MAKKGLRAWVKENWVDIANKRPDGSYPKCGRSGGEKRKKYPKCVPIAKARANTGPTPDRAATFAKRKKAAKGYSAGYTGSAIKTNYGGVQLSNPSYEKYYKGMI